MDDLPFLFFLCFLMTGEAELLSFDGQEFGVLGSMRCMAGKTSFPSCYRGMGDRYLRLFIRMTCKTKLAAFLGKKPWVF
jgi:hypothetical protein